MSEPTSLPGLTIASLLKRTTRPVLLLGAGCSVRSGVPTAETLVGQIAKWGYCVANARNMDDPTVVRTDWWPWLQKQPWYRHDLALTDQYPTAVESVLRPQEDRKAFFRRILNPGLPTSRGYQVLAQVLARKLVLTALTTNFDQLLAGECRSTAAVHHVEEIRTPSDFRLISTSPEYPQIIYLHGSVDHYTDQNIEEETKRLNPELVEKIYPLLRDHPLVVVGYRGGEASIVQHLLLDQVKKCSGYRRGIYWCHRKGDSPEAGVPLLGQLRATLGANFSFVQIDGFDELMIEIAAQLPDLIASSASVQHSAPISVIERAVHDLRPAEVSIDQLDQPLLRAKLVAYCEAVRLPTPTLGTADSLFSAMSERNLALQRADQWTPTKGAQLLFAQMAGDQLLAAKIEVVVDGDPKWVAAVLHQDRTASVSGQPEELTVSGNLWVQLEAILTLLARVNRPFRLKGHASREIYPYPPLALKEIATNLLAHRDYEHNSAARITIRPDYILFENPGGLTDHVRSQLHDREMQSVIQSSARGIKGYRNPVVADFFFSAGAMDKEGSGLPDVVSEAANNLNSLSFGPTSDNKLFRVQISARPEALSIDPKTRTSRPIQREVRFSPNLLSVMAWPEQIWKVPAYVPRTELRNLRERGTPPFFHTDEALWTFVPPTSEAATPFLYLSSSEITPSDTMEFLRRDISRNAIPRLLNSAFEQRLQHLSLSYRFMASSIRAYFPAEDSVDRSVSYRGLFKQAKRTVTKPVVSRTSGQVLFWEHKAVALRFEQFGTVWGLSLLPTYVFTTDGRQNWIDARKIGPRTTKRTARDYNPTVLHSLVFWSRVLSGTVDGSFRLPLDGITTMPDASDVSRPVLEIASLIPIATFEEQAENVIGVGEEISFDSADLTEPPSDDEGLADDSEDEDVD